jgi:transposase-like protein
MKVKRYKALSAMSDDEFDKRFPNEKAAVDHIVNIRYKGNLMCPHCNETVKIYRERKRIKVFNCSNCKNSFSPLTGTIFYKTHIPLLKWFKIIRNFLNDRKGYSACQLERDFKVTYKTAFRILHQIRIATGNKEVFQIFQDIVEIDETYVGGKPRKGNAILDKEGNVVRITKPSVKRGRGTKKVPVVGVKERGTTKVYAQVMLPNEKGEKLTGKQLLEVIEKSCKKGTLVISDDFGGYKILDKKRQKAKYDHKVVVHSKGQYDAGDGVHTNGIENFWSIFKRGVIGTYHQISVKYLQRYVNEFVFRQNTRRESSMFDVLLGQCVLV